MDQYEKCRYIAGQSQIRSRTCLEEGVVVLLDVPVQDRLAGKGMLLGAAAPRGPALLAREPMRRRKVYAQLPCRPEGQAAPWGIAGVLVLGGWQQALGEPPAPWLPGPPLWRLWRRAAACWRTSCAPAPWVVAAAGLWIDRFWVSDLRGGRIDGSGTHGFGVLAIDSDWSTTLNGRRIRRVGGGPTPTQFDRFRHASTGSIAHQPV